MPLAGQEDQEWCQVEHRSGLARDEGDGAPGEVRGDRQYGVRVSVERPHEEMQRGLEAVRFAIGSLDADQRVRRQEAEAVEQRIDVGLDGGLQRAILRGGEEGAVAAEPVA